MSVYRDKKKSRLKKTMPQSASTANTVRIIAGAWRSRVLHFHGAPGLRPTGNRLRETLFNWLQTRSPGARCLDLFAGSGALGIEALSRGADFVQFVEQNAQSLKQISANLSLLNCQPKRFSLFHGSAQEFLSTHAAANGEAFDIAFLDPPFTDGLWQKTIDELIKMERLKPGSLIYVESELETKIDTPGGWQTHRKQVAGSTLARLYQVEAP